MRFYDMIDLYIKYEKLRFYHEVEILKRNVLEDFAYHLDEVKEDLWKIEEITEEDGKSFYKYLLGEKPTLVSVGRSIQILNGFMAFAIKQGWIGKRPWKELYEHRNGGNGHFRLTKKERTALLQYLEIQRPVGLFDKRDQAFLMLLLEYRLRKTEVAELDSADYTGETIIIRSPFKWREREISLREKIKQALDSYLQERTVESIAQKEDALFIGRKKRRLSPGMVKKILETYLARTGGSN